MVRRKFYDILNRYIYSTFHCGTVLIASRPLSKYYEHQLDLKNTQSVLVGLNVAELLYCSWGRGT